MNMAKLSFDINKANLPMAMTSLTAMGVSIAGAGTAGTAGVAGPHAIVGAPTAGAFIITLAPEAVVFLASIAPAFGPDGAAVVQAAKSAKEIHGTVKQVQAMKAPASACIWGKAKGAAVRVADLSKGAAKKVLEQTLGRLVRMVKPTHDYLPKAKFDEMMSKGGKAGEVVKMFPAIVVEAVYKVAKYLVNVTGAVMEQGGEAAVVFKQVLTLAKTFQGDVMTKAKKGVGGVSGHGFIDERIGKDIYPIFPRYTPWWNLVHRLRDKYSPSGVSRSGPVGAVVAVGAAAAAGGAAAGLTAITQLTLAQVFSRPARYWSHYKIGPIRFPFFDRPSSAGVLRTLFKWGTFDPEKKAPIIGIISASPLFPRLYNLWDATGPTKSMGRKDRFAQKAAALGYTQGEVDAFLTLMSRPNHLTNGKFGFVKSGYTREKGGRPKKASRSKYKFVAKPKKGKPGFYGRPRKRKN